MASQILITGCLKISLQRFLSELISWEVAEEEELTIRAAQNVKMLWKDASGASFHTSISPRNTGQFFIKTKDIAFSLFLSSAIFESRRKVQRFLADVT